MVRFLHACLFSLLVWIMGMRRVLAEPIAEVLGPGLTRYWHDESAREAAVPSPFLLNSVEPRLTVREGRVRPQFATSRGGWIASVTLDPGTSLYGTGEVAGPLLRNGCTIVCWNTDSYGYTAGTQSLYQSHPWVLGVRADGTAFGILVDNPGRTVVDLRHRIEFRALGPAFPVLILEAETPQDVLRDLATLTGRMPLPPKWALGFHQCRYSYFPQSELTSLAREFRRRQLPCDVLWLDIDYMDRYKSFTWSPRHFPSPSAMHDTLHALGFRTVAILDPGIHAEAGYFVYDQGTAGDHWVKDAAGRPYVGRVWPGDCVWPDFTRGATRDWWADRVREFVLQSGVDGIWNDMNEPAVFGTHDKTMPELNLHAADAALGGPGLHGRYHNVYGALMARASRQGLRAARPERRPFVLTRAGCMGSQRDAATWTGDNRATWEHLQMSVPMSLNLGLSGQPFSGPDLGGFGGGGEAALFARWFGVGALFPFMRAHSEKGTIRKEPWSFGPEVEATCRRALQIRYRLLPYLYTLFEAAARTGLPVMRPAFFADLRDPALRTEQRAFLLGDDLWVSPGLDAGDPESRPRPPAGWAAVEVIPDAATDHDLPRLFVRPGAAIPLGPVMQHVDAVPLVHVEWIVHRDARGVAVGFLYEDAGDGYDFEQGEFRRTRAEVAGDRITVTQVEGSWPEPASRRHSIAPSPAARRP
jgi:alpha-glucosidase